MQGILEYFLGLRIEIYGGVVKRVCAVVVPVYKANLSKAERFSLVVTLGNLKGYPLWFLHPIGMDLSEYEDSFPFANYIKFDSNYFVSNKTYSALCLSEDLYKSFVDFEYILIAQTDAIVLRRDLDEWCKHGWAYIGAPIGVSIKTNCEEIWNEMLPQCSGYWSQLPVGSVGNGGLSLRNINATLNVLNVFSRTVDRFVRDLLPEDIFFSYCGLSEENFRVPPESMAARFALEMHGPAYIRFTGELPLGVHAWGLHDREFWAGVFYRIGLIRSPAELPI
jgi:hypothetical protein